MIAILVLGVLALLVGGVGVVSAARQGSNAYHAICAHSASRHTSTTLQRQRACANGCPPALAASRRRRPRAHGKPPEGSLLWHFLISRRTRSGWPAGKPVAECKTRPAVPSANPDRKPTTRGHPCQLCRSQNVQSRALLAGYDPSILENSLRPGCWGVVRWGRTRCWISPLAGVHELRNRRR